ncbi:MAG: NADH-quinone oxidoreductase subunit J [Nitrospirae bacterium]|nr:NADH-quinone oxidoreductase subunit J [Nitrospirota bacterium]
MAKYLFALLGSLATLGALGTIFLPNPVHAALALIVALVATAGVYVVLSAPFVAVLQVAVYAGAIMVLFLFVVMLLNVQGRAGKRTVWMGLGVLGGGLMMVQILHLVRMLRMPSASVTVPGFGSPQAVSEFLFAKYAIPFELISVLLLVAIVGAVLLGRKEAPSGR